MAKNNKKTDNDCVNTNEQHKETPKENSDKTQCVALFNDLKTFLNRNVQIALYGGEKIIGKIISFDEVANCILECENKQKIIVLGKSITGIYFNETIVL